MAEIEFEELPEMTSEEIPTGQPEISLDKTTEELAAYKRHFEALQADLMEIEQKYHEESKAADSALEKRVSGIEKGMQEIKELLQQKQSQPIPPIPQYQPQYPPQYPQYQPMPMYSLSAPIMPPVVTMPYGR